jgi:hypothetical protein
MYGAEEPSWEGMLMVEKGPPPLARSTTGGHRLLDEGEGRTATVAHMISGCDMVPSGVIAEESLSRRRSA